MPDVGSLPTRRICAATFLLLGAVACRGDAPPLRIGVVMGPDGVSGALAAAEEVNAAGGIDGRPLELVLLPASASDAEPAIRGAEQLAADPTILAVVGHTNSSASLAASQVYNAHGVVQISPTSTATLLGMAGPYSFRMVPTDRSQAVFLAAEAQRLAAARSAMIVYENDDYGRGLQRDVSRELAARGIRVLASVPYLARAGDEAMEFIPRRLAHDPPQVVFWLGREPKLLPFLRRVRIELPDALVLASEGVDSPQLYRDAREYAGLHLVRFVDAGSIEPCRERLRGHEEAQMGGRSQDVLTHDAVLVLVAAMRAGARTRDEIRDWLAELGTRRPAVPGCAGPIAFDSTRGGDRPYLLARADSQGIAPLPERR